MHIIFILFFLTAKVIKTDEKYKIKGDASDVLIDLADQSFKAIGGSSAVIDDMKVYARKITKDKDKNLITAEGKITFIQDNKYKVVADTIEIDLDKKIAKIKKGKTYINSFYITGENIEAKFPDKLTVTNATITTCSLDCPHFHIKAQEVVFYPNSKFIGYRGWIYIGKSFRLFPIPIYGSYVTEQKDKAPLFPEIKYDEKKGLMVLYGFDYKIFDDKTIGIIEKINLSYLINLEYSQKRSLGVEKLKILYSAHDILSGEFLVQDWISAPTESDDESLLKKQKNLIDKSLKGSSYKIISKTSIKSKKGFIKLSDSYLLSSSNLTMDFKKTKSDLEKDSKGNYLKKDTIKNYFQVDINTHQKIYKYLDINYKFKSISASEDTIKELFKEQDKLTDESPDPDRYNMDTKRENDLKLLQDDHRTHKIALERRRNRDLRPEKGDSGKSKFDNRDFLDVNIKKLSFSFNYEKLEKDSWSSKLFSSLNKRENYVSSEELTKKIKVTLGDYYIFWTGFAYNINYTFNDKETKKFEDPKNKYTNIDKRLQTEYEYKNREKFITKNEKFKYNSLINEIKNEYFNLLDFETFKLGIKPSYSADLRKYLSYNKNSNKSLAENKKNYKPISSYVDLIVHRIKYSIPFVIYDNSLVENRRVDLKIMNTPLSERSFVRGTLPEDQTPPDETRIYANKTDIDIGNIKNTYIYKRDRSYNYFDKFIKKSLYEHKVEIKLENDNLFTFQYIDKEEKNEKEIDPSLSNIQKYKFDTYLIGLGYNRSKKKDISKTFSKSSGYNEVIKNESEYILRIVDLEGKYLKEDIEDKAFKNISRNKYSLHYNKKFKELNTSIEVKGSYSTEVDKTDINNLKYKDNILTFTFNFIDNRAVENDKKLKLDEALKIDIAVKNDEDEEELEKSKIDFEFDELKDNDFVFEKEKDIDKILKNVNKKPKLNIMDLGEDKKEEKLQDKSTKFSFEIKLVNDSEVFHKKSIFSYNDFCKEMIFDVFLKYSSYFEISYKVNKSRKSIEDNFKKDEIKFKFNFQLGYKDYEWYPGLSFHRMKDENEDKKRFEDIFFTLDHNIHCTKYYLNIGASHSKKTKKYIPSFGIRFEIKQFPSKNLGLNIRDKKIENISFGL